MELLDYLVELLGCAYLSDLHYRSFPAQQARAVLDIPDGRFPLEQYADAICYLLGEAPLPPDLASAKQARAVLDIPDGRFPLEQYADAICYLLGEAPLPPDLASAKQALAAALAADRAER